MPLPRVISVVQRRAPAADGINTYTLEPQPLSALLLWVSGSATAANAAASFADLVGLIDDINVTVAGTSILQGSLADLVAYQAAILRRPIRYEPHGDAIDDLSQIYCVLPLSRQLGDPAHCLPGTPAGALRVAVTEDIAQGGLDTLVYSIDAYHIDDATPSSFLRCQTLTRTAPATGDDRIDLPTGRPLEGVLVFGTTQRVTEAGLRGINRLKILRDAVDVAYPSIEWESAQALNHALGGPFGSAWDHQHEENIAAAYTQFAEVRNAEYLRGAGFSHSWLEFDPLADYSQFLDATQCNRVQLQSNFGTAELYRVLPVEIWTRETARNQGVPFGA